MTSGNDDDELTFEEIEDIALPDMLPDPLPAEPGAADAAKPDHAPAAAEPAKAADTAAGGAPAAPAKAKPPLAGILLAAVLVLCLVTSTFAAWQSMRAANAAIKQTSGDADPKAVVVRLKNIERLMEAQRDAIDNIASRPSAVAAATAPGSESAQINALASAVRANQDMSDRIPSLIANQVQASVARAVAPVRKAAAAPKPATGKIRLVSARAPLQGKPTMLVKVAPPPPPPPPPPGDAIRYTSD